MAESVLKYMLIIVSTNFTKSSIIDVSQDPKYAPKNLTLLNQDS